MNDQINMFGIFRMKMYCVHTGALLKDYSDFNLIVNNGRTAITRLLGGDAANRSLTKISFGTNNTAPTATDTAITSPFTKSLGTVSYPSISSVKYEWTLEANEANGKAITEFGLLCNDNTLFARKTREAINKNSDIRLVGSWEITF